VNSRSRNIFSVLTTKGDLTVTHTHATTEWNPSASLPCVRSSDDANNVREALGCDPEILLDGVRWHSVVTGRDDTALIEELAERDGVTPEQVLSHAIRAGLRLSRASTNEQ
jgi:hypothetical protein